MRAMQYANELRETIMGYLPSEGMAQYGQVGFARRDHSGITEHRFDRPLASLLVQGAKTTVTGGQAYEVESGQILIVAVDMPSSSHIRHASAESPLLTVFFPLTPQTIAELLLDGAMEVADHHPAPRIASVISADEDLLATTVRLAKAAKDDLRCRLLLRELHYLLLTGAHGSLLRTMYGKGLPGSQLIQAITYLRNHLNVSVRSGDLAEAACMSESSLYRNFKTFIGLSPLQYHKQLRLHEARRMMLAENERAAEAAFRVGYESVAQFSREYKKLFGQPPKRDTRGSQ